MTDNALEGLDALVAEAMGRKIVPSPLREETSAKNDGLLSLAQEEPVEAIVEPAVDTSGPPPVSIAFAVNGVKCIVTIHVQQGATVSLPPAGRKATQSGPKVKGIRGATSDENEALEGSEPAQNVDPAAGLDEGLHPTIPRAWNCPEHGTHEAKTSKVTGRIYLVCGTPGCDKLAPK